MARQQIRQGDVLLVPVDEPEEPLRACDADGRPLAGVRVEGERTGHAHVLPAAVYDADGGRRLALLERPGQIEHPQHGVAEVPAGWWDVRVQREHVPARAPAGRYD